MALRKERKQQNSRQTTLIRVGRWQRAELCISCVVTFLDCNMFTFHGLCLQVIDLTSKSSDGFQLLSPFATHKECRIQVPGRPEGITADSLEGIWQVSWIQSRDRMSLLFWTIPFWYMLQGLKVFTGKHGIRVPADPQYFYRDGTKLKKRTVKSYGKVN